MLFRKRTNTSSNDLMHKQLTTITVIFSIVAAFFIGVGIIIGVFSYKSVEQITEARKELTDHKNELFNEVNDFRENLLDKTDQRYYALENKIQILERRINSKLNESLEDYENRFDKLSGETLKKPKLKILYNDKLLNGQKITLNRINNKFAIPPISIENEGNRELQLPSINISFSKKISKLSIYSSGRNIESYWEERSVLDNLYPAQFQYVIWGVREDLAIISPQEIDELPSTIIENFDQKWDEIECIVKVFYSTEPPEIAKFTLIKPK